MLLEQNRIAGIVVHGTPKKAKDLKTWRRIAERHRVAFLVAAEDEDAAASLDAFATVVTWNDTCFPATAGNIKAALEIMDLQPYNTLYVTDEADSIEEAIGTRVGTVQIGEILTNDYLPDISIANIDELEVMLDENSQGIPYGYLGEVRSTRGNNGHRAASHGFVFIGENVLTKRPYLDNATTKRMGLAILGRYFPRTDLRHHKHQYSQRLLHMKSEKPRGDVLAEPLAEALTLLADHMPYEIITRVPPKPSKDSDHLLRIIRRAIKFAERSSGVKLSPKLKGKAIVCNRDYKKQSTVGAPQLRAKNVIGAFSADPTLVKGKSVLLIDDVLTSGSTVTEAAKALYEAGASVVTTLVFGFDQKIIQTGESLTCPNGECTGTMVVRYNGNDDGAFWGCDQYFDKGCRESHQWRRGLVLANRLNSREEISVWGDIEF